MDTCKNHRTQTGMTILELLIALFLGSLVLGLVFSTFQMFQRFRILSESKNNLLQNTELLREVVVHDIANACTGLNRMNFNILSVKDIAGNKSKPAIFLNDKGTVLNIIEPNAQGFGRIEVANGSKLVLSKVDPDKWLNLNSNDLVFVLDGAATPAFCRLTTKPRMATLTDLQGQTTAFLWPDRTMVIELTPATCLGTGSITSSIPTTGQCFSINQIVQFEINPQKIIRREISNCGNSSTPLSSDFGDGYDFSQLQFQYVTPSGDSTTLPVNPSTITGVRLVGKISDPTTKLVEDINYEIAIDAWKLKE